MKVEARRELLSPPDDVWKLIAEPYHLPDWWPGYVGVEPDRRGLAEGARWRIVRGSTQAATSNLLRRAGGSSTIVIRRVIDGSLLAWTDTGFRLDAAVTLSPAAQRRTEVAVTIEASWARIYAEGLRSVPRHAVLRLYDLCQTAAEL
jgi:uncharacterized protein YndB with AHSA1/START domain